MALESKSIQLYDAYIKKHHIDALADYTRERMSDFIKTQKLVVICRQIANTKMERTCCIIHTEKDLSELFQIPDLYVLACYAALPCLNENALFSFLVDGVLHSVGNSSYVGGHPVIDETRFDFSEESVFFDLCTVLDRFDQDVDPDDTGSPRADQGSWS